MIYGEENKREKISGSGTDFPVGDCCPRVPLIVTRPEAIGTLEEYRGQGLVNAHLDAHNKWATELCAVMQIISGIPGYYHRFGYENSLPTEITHVGYMHNVDSIVMDKQFNFRLATTADVDFIDRVARVAAIKRLSLWTDRDRIGWKNIIGGRIQGSCGARPVFLIERDSTKIGFVVMSATDDSCVLQFELDEPRNTNYASWTDVTLALIKWLPTFHLEHFLPILKEQNPQKYERDRKDRASTLVSNGWSFKFELGYSHPCLSAVGQSMLPRKPYQNKTWKAFWYTRIEDRTAFLRAIKPVLNYRLQSSTFEAITRKLYITSGFHSKKNVLIDIVNGMIKDISTVTDIQNPISIQNELFTPIVLGTKSFSETVQDRGDVFSLSEINAEIIDVLFPKMVNDQVHGMD
ncbi:hypothetical protein HDV04_001484 [Boothiomyces sp. JEL0838]|nr:hypothetical protein HDV04_001484 [Boothiomyces sp. JEL0838]